MTTERAWSVRDLVLDGVLRSAPLSVFAYDGEGTCLFSQGAALRQMGLEPDQLVGQNLFELYGDVHDVADRLRRALAGETFHVTDRLGGRTYDTWYLPVGYVPGHGACAIGLSVDVTDRVKAEEGEQVYRAFVEAAPQFIAIASLDGSVTYVNPGGRALAGIPDDVDVTRTSIPDYLTPEGLEASLEVEQPAVVRDGAWEGETTLRHWPTGEGIPVKVASFLVRDTETGEPIAMATVQADIRDVVAGREAVQQQMAHQRGMLHHLHEAQEAERQRIAADIHDDTVQVIAAVNLRLQTLRRSLEPQLSPERAAELATLDQAVRDAGQRLRRLLGALDQPDTVGDVAAGLRGAVDRTLDRGLPTADVRVDIETEPTPMVARTVVRLAIEALTNVRKHAEATTVLVELTQDGGEYVLRVIDDGRGLSPQTRRDTMAHRGVRGMRERAESVGGRLTVSDRPGGGVAVEARLPNVLGHPDDDASALQSRRYLEQIVEDIDGIYCAIDSQWRYVYMNQAGYRVLHRDPADSVVGKRIWDEFDITPEFAAAYHRAMDEKVAVEITGYYEPWDSWIYNRILPTAGGLTIFGRDVTEERRAAQEAEHTARLVAAGRALVSAATADVDMRTAVSGAAAALCAGWALRGVRITFADGAGVVGAGELSGPVRRVPLTVGEVAVGCVELAGEQEPVDPDLLQLIALRLSTQVSG